MSLYARVLVGYGVLFALIVVSALGAAIGFRDLGTNIGRVLEDNYASIQASNVMIDSLERQDSAVLAALVDPQTPTSALVQARNAFREALGDARGNITLPEEVPTLDRIERAVAAYQQACAELLASPGSRSLTDYESTVHPRFRAAKEAILQLMELNHRAMVEADQQARIHARERAAIHGLLVALAAVTVVPLVRAMSRNLLSRLQHLREVAEAIAGGDRRRRVTIDRDDELGLIGRQLNAMLDRQAEIEADFDGRVATEHQFVLGLLNALPEPAALLTRSGRLLASTLPAADRRRLQQQLPLASERLATYDATQQSQADGFAFRLQRLDDDSGRPVGWLATQRDGRSG